MSSYFYLWQASERGKDLLLPVLFLAVLIQIVGYDWLSKRSQLGSWVYFLAVLAVDVVISLIIGVQVK